MSVAISNLTATWSNSANVYNAIQMNVTTNAYDANSTLLNLKANGNSVFSVSADGTANIDFISITGYGKGNIGDVLTSNGSNMIMWTAGGGMTNLGAFTLLTGSSTQTLSGLTLTNYKMLNITLTGIGKSGGGTAQLYFTADTSKTVSDPGTNFGGNILIYLENRTLVSLVRATSVANSIVPYNQTVNFSASNTSVTLGITGATFQSNGTAIVYGIK